MGAPQSGTLHTYRPRPPAGRGLLRAPPVSTAPGVAQARAGLFPHPAGARRLDRQVVGFRGQGLRSRAGRWHPQTSCQRRTRRLHTHSGQAQQAGCRGGGGAHSKLVDALDQGVLQALLHGEVPPGVLVRRCAALLARSLQHSRAGSGAQDEKAWAATAVATGCSWTALDGRCRAAARRADLPFPPNMLTVPLFPAACSTAGQPWKVRISQWPRTCSRTPFPICSQSWTCCQRSCRPGGGGQHLHGLGK